MIIDRIQVEEGFLDGLDLEFSRGLNVLIGARGVGKTSVLELIRYALNIPHIDERRSEGAARHAEAILGGGRVTVRYHQNGQLITATRSVEDPVPAPNMKRMGSSFPSMIGQNELEGIGLDPTSRLRLLDRYARIDLASISKQINELSDNVRELTRSIKEFSLERDGLAQREMIRSTVSQQLREARSAEEALFASASAEIAAARDTLADSSRRIAYLNGRVGDLTNFQDEVSEVGSDASRIQRAISVLVDQARLLEETGIDDRLGHVVDLYADMLSAMRNVREMASLRIIETQQEISDLNDAIRPLRVRHDKFQEGASAAAQLTAMLEQQLAEIESAQARRLELDKRIARHRRTRDALLYEIDNIRESLWVARSRVGKLLSEKFAPRIRISMDHYGDRSKYQSALAEALTGSGLKFNALAASLAELITPVELVSAVEDRDVALLRTVGNLASNRVERIFAHLASSDALGEILAAPLEDTVDFELLVGRDYRKTETLSTGQRCSVVLPILLADLEQPLLMDQPEDHLDNAYLVESTIEIIRARKESAQTIVVTHNANIPVLGDADLVVALDSDGRRGFVRQSGKLNSPEVINSITELMEGGAEAFRRRSAFYQRH